ncbi:hypothetical protein KJ840_04125 [Patescibacteria group bacterium]|nr:hypothetical protein [Patescibacteria group bacterium]
MAINELKNKKIHLIGVSGAEGSSLALFLIKLGCQNLIGHDFSNRAEFKKNYLLYHSEQSKDKSFQQINKIKKGLKVINYKNSYLKNIKDAEIIFAPYSWRRYPVNRPLKNLRKNQLFWHWYNLLLEYYQGALIGVTGTAGKGTTTGLIYSILKAAKKKVWLVGDSWQMMDFYQILTSGKPSFVVAELSNRALTFAEYSKKSPHLAVITNITKNHLDDHSGSFKKYIAAKKAIAKYQKPDDFLILNSLDFQTRQLKNFAKSKKIFYSAQSREKKLIKNKMIRGSHFTSDAAAAIKTAKILKISKTAIIKGLNGFKSRAGRMQFIKKFNKISFINDAASTRPEATMAAVKTFARGKVNLILEGYRHQPDKQQFLKLAKVINSCGVKNIAVSGRITKFLLPILQQTKARVFSTHNLAESVEKMCQNSRAGDFILLSPACESFGEFKDYRERMEKFNQIIKKISHGPKIKN